MMERRPRSRRSKQSSHCKIAAHGSLDDDNSAPGQDPLPTISRDEPILALQDASERDKGLMWQDDELPPLSDVCTRVLTANVCHPNVGDTLPVAAEQPKIVDKL